MSVPCTQYKYIDLCHSMEITSNDKVKAYIITSVKLACFGNKFLRQSAVNGFVRCVYTILLAIISSHYGDGPMWIKLA